MPYLIGFPLGVSNAAQVPMETVLRMAHQVGDHLRAGNSEEIADLFHAQGIPEAHAAEAVRQFACGLSFIQSVDERRVRLYSRLFENAVRSQTDLSDGDHARLPELLRKNEAVLDSVFGELRVKIESGDDLFAEGRRENVSYRAYLPWHRGSRAFVTFVDLTLDGKTYECVVRSKVEDAQNYEDLIRQRPDAVRYPPRLYGIVGSHVVMERLRGLEYRRLTRWLGAEDGGERVRAYAGAVSEAIEDLSQRSIRFGDVHFGVGHNCVFEPVTGTIRIVEQSALLADNDWTPAELAAQQLFKEVSYPRTGTEYRFELLRLAFKRRPPDHYFVRAIEAEYGHPAFDAHIDYLMNLILLPCDPEWQEYRRILDDPVLRTGYRTIITHDRETQVFSDDLIRSVVAGDKLQFERVLKRGNAVVSLTDSEDPRSRPIFLVPRPSFS
ncbi:MAG TPA: hypothetical protein VFX30_13770 [bacterium]|nr:hypothetical protein [bacterium]